MFGPRPVQTRVKHIILERYLKAWGGIIIQGSRQSIYKARQHGRRAGLQLIYVDCFAGKGRYKGELEDQKNNKPFISVYGSPIIGIQVLDGLVKFGRENGVPVITTSVLIEELEDSYSELIESLEAACLTSRVKTTTDFGSLSNGEIALVRADSTTLVDDLLDYTTANQYAYSFYLLDPFGPTGIPLKNVSKVISKPRHDVLINMPYQDLHKKSGFVGKQNLSKAQESLLQNYDKMFGNTTWQRIVEDWQNSSTDQKSEELEIDLANHYRGVLHDVDKQLAVKSIPLRFSDQERTMYHLYLTTHDANGSLQMNQIMRDAETIEHNLRWKLKLSKLTHGGQQMGLFKPSELVPLAPQLQRDYIDEIADKIIANYAGTTVDRGQIYRLLSDDIYLPSEINKALTKLRNKDKKANFEGQASKLRNNSPIEVFS
jgi:three-Cys-motif partner protein